MIWVVTGLVAISYAARSAKDKLSFHYSTSIFSKRGFNPLFWNPRLSWMNKWKEGNPKKGPKFPMSTTALVFTTDGWHLFSFIEINALMIAMALLVSMVGYNVILCFIALRVIYGIVFNLFYDYILKK